MSSAASFRIEKDLLGTLEVPAEAYYGIQTLRAIHNFRLSGVPLAFTTWSSPAADPQGRWIARNLPPKPTRFLALPISSATSIEARTFDGMATLIPFPWASPASVTTVE